MSVLNARFIQRTFKIIIASALIATPQIIHSANPGLINSNQNLTMYHDSIIVITDSLIFREANFTKGGLITKAGLGLTSIPIGILNGLCLAFTPEDLNPLRKLGKIGLIFPV